jgi:hypothetical protein
MIFALFPLLILGGIIALIVRFVGNRGDGPEAGGDAVRRFFQYALLLGLVSIVATGAANLLASALPAETLLRSGSNAQPVAFLIIGVPVLYALVRWVNRSLESEDERRSLGWALYISFTAFTALVTTIVGLFGVGEAILGIDDFDPAGLARALVWGLVWAIHWKLSARQDPGNLLWLHLVAGSATGLVIVAFSFAGLINSAVSVVYETVFGITIVSRDSELLGQSIIGLAIGGATWWHYWLRTFQDRVRQTAWKAYVLLAGVLGGLVTLLASTAGFLFLILDWFFGGVDERAPVHFEAIPSLLGAMAVGAALWAYHRSVFRSDGPTERDEARRLYDYLVAGVGLVAATAGITTIVVAAIQSVLPSSAVLSDSGGASTLMDAIAAIAVGVPVWRNAWQGIQRHRAATPAQELASGTRRIYLFALFGVGGVVALGALLTLAVTVLEDLFDSAFGSSTIYDIRVPLALVITVGAVAAYHWSVRSEDQEDTPAPEEIELPVRLVVLVSNDGRDVSDQITSELGIRVRVWDQPEGTDAPSFETLREIIETGTHPRLLVIAQPGGFTAVPYTERV